MRIGFTRGADERLRAIALPERRAILRAVKRALVADCFMPLQGALAHLVRVSTTAHHCIVRPATDRSDPVVLALLPALNAPTTTGAYAAARDADARTIAGYARAAFMLLRA